MAESAIVPAARSALTVSAPAVSETASPATVEARDDAGERRQQLRARRRGGDDRAQLAARVVQQVRERVGDERAVGLGDADRAQQRGEDRGRAGRRGRRELGGQRGEQSLRLGQQRRGVQRPGRSGRRDDQQPGPVGAERRALAQGEYGVRRPAGQPDGDPSAEAPQLQGSAPPTGLVPGPPTSQLSVSAIAKSRVTFGATVTVASAAAIEPNCRAIDPCSVIP